MVVLEQTLFGFLRYRKVFFPTLEGITSLTAKLAVNDVIRFQYKTGETFDSPYLVESFPVSSVCIDLTQDPDAILKAMDRRSGRYLRAAEKLASRIEVAMNTEPVTEDYLEVYNAFARVKGRVPKLSRRVVDLYRPVSDIFVLYFDGRAMCAHLTVKDEEAKRLYSMFGGNRRLESKADADLCGKLERFLFWHEIRSYQARGMELYSLGGIAHEDLNAPFNQFKLRFGGVVLTEYSYTFSGAPKLARFGLAAYKRLRNSRAAKVIGRV